MMDIFEIAAVATIASALLVFIKEIYKWRLRLKKRKRQDD